MTEPSSQKTHEQAISTLTSGLVNALILESEDKGFGDTPSQRIRSLFKDNTSSDTLAGITALSSYMAAKAAERQAAALESVAKVAGELQSAGSSEATGQAMIDLREPKRESLADTYSLPTTTLTLLWALRGILVDAAIRSLSKPDRFDPYRTVTTEEIAWTLRVDSPTFYQMLPVTSTGDVDFALLEAFDILHYGGNDGYPDNWMYGG